MALPGAEKNWLQACSTVVSLNAMSRPPSTTAAAKARIVTTVGLPLTTASRIVRLNEAAGRRAAGAGRADGGGGEPDCCSLTAAPPALRTLGDPRELPRPGPAVLSCRISP